MYVRNLVLLQGHLSSAPRVRELPSGSRLLQLEVTTASPDGEPAASVPVVWFDPPARCGLDPDTPVSTEVIVRGSVRRRYFRHGGVTSSRTEVVAASVVPMRRTRSVEVLLARVAADLADGTGPADGCRAAELAEVPGPIVGGRTTLLS